MDSPRKYDFVVIGSGPGGQKAACQGVSAGRSVAIIERERNVGGACVYRGTIPSKTLREAALAISQMRRNAAVLNVEMREDLEVSSLMERLTKVLAAHRDYMKENLETEGVTHIHGRARLTGPNRVEVQSLRGEATVLEAGHIVVATGSVPRRPDNVPVDHEHILDSDSILSMIYVPASLTVLGGGVIACEYASIFSQLGTKVTIVDKAPRPLMFMEPELTEKFVHNFERHGGTYLGQQAVRSVRWDGFSQVITELENGETLNSDKLLSAQGRVANVRGLGLEEVGIDRTERGHIRVNDNYQTSIPSIYAVGDVIGPPALAASSMEQGRRAVCHALGLDPGNPFEIVPIGIYSVPEMASVGLTEEQAREKYGAVTVGRVRFDEIARGLIAGIEDGLLKLVADGNGRKLLGVQIVGLGATDLIHVGEMALINGNNVNVFLENIMNFPTLGEAYRVAASRIVSPVRHAEKPEPACAGVT